MASWLDEAKPATDGWLSEAKPVEPQGFWARAMSREPPPELQNQRDVFSLAAKGMNWLGQKQAEADERTQREHPTVAPYLKMMNALAPMMMGGSAGGGYTSGSLPRQLPASADPVTQQIARMNNAAPAQTATGGLPEIPRALDMVLPKSASMAYDVLRKAIGKGGGASAPRPNPYPEGSFAPAARPPTTAALPASVSQELNPALQAAQAESRARVDKWAQAAAQAQPAAPATVEQAVPRAVEQVPTQAPPVLPRAVEQASEAAPAASNIYEQAGRANKVQELVKAIDANAGAHLGVDPRDPRFAEALADLPAEWWEGMGRVAKVNKPSPQTVSDTMEFFRDRAAQAVPRAAAQ